MPKIAPLEALKMLTDGNARFAAGTRSHPHETLDSVKETAKDGQHPFVTILSCSDSRVPLHVIFDEGIGDIFSICVAGNLVGEHVLGSIEFGVAQLGTPLCVVLGHTQCGAVIAACTGDGNVRADVSKFSLAIFAKTSVRNSGDSAARNIICGTLCLPFIPPNNPRAKRRNLPKFSAPFPRRVRLLSSPKLTSSTQCNRFSIPQ